MVIPCSRSAFRPSVRSAKSISLLGRLLARQPSDRGELVLVDVLRVVQQAADQRGLAVVDAARRGEAQQILLAVLLQEVVRSRASEVPLPLLHLHRAFGVVVDDPGGALRDADGHHLLDDLRHRLGPWSGSRPVQG